MVVKGNRWPAVDSGAPVTALRALCYTRPTVQARITWVTVDQERPALRLHLLPICVLVLSAPLLAAGKKPVITIAIQGDHVEFDREAGTLAVHGGVTITAQSDQPGMPTVAVASGELEADLSHGLIIAHEGVRLRSQQLAMRGERAEIRFTRDEFILHGGRVSVEMPAPGGPDRPVRGYFFGDEIRKEADVVYVVEGRMTTCDRVHPHYSVGVKELTYDTRTTRWTIREGRLSLYGHTLRIPGAYSALLRGSGTQRRQTFLTPGYSSYDGLYVPVSWDLSGRGSEWEVSATVRLGTELRFPGEVAARRTSGRQTLTLAAARRQLVAWDVDQWSRINLLPELSLSRPLSAPSACGDSADLNLSLASIREEPMTSPAREAIKASVSVGYASDAQARRQRQGAWWAVSGEQSLYDTGERLRDLQLELGIGSDQSRATRGALWYVRHQASGSTPFLFDDIYAENELYGQFTLGLGQDWSLDSYARLDLDESRLRQWQIGVYRRLHCLTWGLRWDRAGETLSLEVNVNGLTGDTLPYDSRPVVTADEVPPLPPMVPAAAPEALTKPAGKD